MKGAVFLKRCMKAAGAAVLLAGAAGCSSTYMVSIDAVDAGGAGRPGYAFVIEPPRHVARADTFDYAAILVRTALSAKGLYEAPDAAQADFVVSIDYGVGPRRMVVERLAGAAYDPSVRGDAQQVPSAGRAGYDGFGRARSGVARAATGGEKLLVSHVWPKHLSIAARTRPADGAAAAMELWRVTVSTDDGGASIEEVLPVLAGAAMDYLGTNSEVRLTRRLSARSEPVVFVSGGP